jgi:hypothetical protein
VLPPFLADPEGVRPYFRRLKKLGAEAFDHGLAGRELSMGMSHDFEIAIEEGATFIRVGTALFGARTRETGEAAGPGGPHPPRARSEGSERARSERALR